MVGSNSRWDPQARMYEMSAIVLAQKIYAIVDAFRNIVERCYGNTGPTILPPSLMEICLGIIGGDIEMSVQELLAEKPDEDDDESGSDERSRGDSDDDEEDETAVIDGCYEQIPEHLRRWALVPHALQIILMHVPIVIPTLLELCLDVVLESGPRHDSLIIMRHLIRYAITPRGGYAPITAPQHANYLVSLLRKPNTPSKPLTQSWAEPDFVEEVTNCVHRLDSKSQADFWRSRAVHGLFLVLSDPKAQLHLILNLAKLDRLTGPLRALLCSWAEAIFSMRMAAPSRGRESDPNTEVTSTNPHIDIHLLCTLVSGLAPLTNHDFKERTIEALVICIGTVALATTIQTGRTPQSSESKAERELVEIMRKISSTPFFTPACFNVLLNSRSEEHLTQQDQDGDQSIADAQVQEPRLNIPNIVAYATALQATNLPEIAFALLAITVHVYESTLLPFDEDLGRGVDVTKEGLRQRLAEAKAQCGYGQSDWEWDDMEELWVRAKQRPLHFEGHVKRALGVLGKRRIQEKEDEALSSRPVSRQRITPSAFNLLHRLETPQRPTIAVPDRRPGYHSNHIISSSPDVLVFAPLNSPPHRGAKSRMRTGRYRRSPSPLLSEFGTAPDLNPEHEASLVIRDGWEGDGAMTQTGGATQSRSAQQKPRIPEASLSERQIWSLSPTATPRPGSENDGEGEESSSNKNQPATSSGDCMKAVVKKPLLYIKPVVLHQTLGRKMRLERALSKISSSSHLETSL
ncbi:hypothetical protein FRB94_014402 [Tulasnella sp. JGI-2019a]|nr:hypothetical protein FRB94_014402 [Tulasnella sp. JGI-2019a]